MHGIVGKDVFEPESSSLHNPQQAQFVVDMVLSLLADPKLGVTTDDIGVIAPFFKQVLELRRLLRQHQLNAVRVGSVDDYQ